MKAIKSLLPWTAIIDGDDLVVMNIMATCWGGGHDNGDDGTTESGIPNDGTDLTLMGVALPIRSIEDATRGSPLAFPGPHIPWETQVNVWSSQAPGKVIACKLIDNGPNVLLYPTHALDLNPNVVLQFLPKADRTRVANYWSGSSFCYRIIGVASLVPAEWIVELP